MMTKSEELMSAMFLSGNKVMVGMVADYHAQKQKASMARKLNPQATQEKSQYEKILGFFNKIEVGLIAKFLNAEHIKLWYKKDAQVLGLRDSIQGEMFGDESNSDYGWFVVTLNDPRCKNADPKKFMKLKISARDILQNVPTIAMTYSYINGEGKEQTRYCYILDEKTDKEHNVKFFTASEMGKTAEDKIKQLAEELKLQTMENLKTGEPPKVKSAKPPQTGGFIKGQSAVISQPSETAKGQSAKTSTNVEASDSESNDDWDTWYDRSRRGSSKTSGKSTNSRYSSTYSSGYVRNQARGGRGYSEVEKPHSAQSVLAKNNGKSTSKEDALDQISIDFSKI